MTLPLRLAITDALRWWERRRALYNFALAAVVIGYFVAYWPASRLAVQLDSLLWLFVLTVFANVCYSVAYVPDLLVQFSAFRAMRHGLRWLLFAIGLLLAAVLTRWVAIGIFGAAEHTAHVLGQ